MNAAFIKVGLSACDVGVSYLLPRLVGSSIASELMLTGRFIDAERALRIGLISEIVAKEELQAAGTRLANELLEAAPLGLRLTKEGISAALAAPTWKSLWPSRTAIKVFARRMAISAKV